VRLRRYRLRGAQRLKPERIAEARQENRRAVVAHNHFCDCSAELRHALGKPLQYTAAVKRKVGNAGTFHGRLYRRPAVKVLRRASFVPAPNAFIGRGLADGGTNGELAVMLPYLNCVVSAGNCLNVLYRTSSLHPCSRGRIETAQIVFVSGLALGSRVRRMDPSSRCSRPN
jgi:hypothetical protein